MKLFRFGAIGEEKPGLLDARGVMRDVSKHVTDFTPLYVSEPDFLARLQALDTNKLPKLDDGVRLGPPIGLPGKMIGVGLNSALHTEQLGMRPFPEHDMLLFMKASSSICGPCDPILYSRFMQKLDWEAELAIVIGKRGKYIEQAKARDFILGYTCMNDLSERFLQFEMGDSQFTKGKCFDNAAPLGPYIVTPDEMDDPNQLEVNLWVNDALRQAFNTRNYIHHDCEVVSYVSQYFTLYPGDVISMGSAPGNAAYWGSDAFLKPGDNVVLSIEGLGTQMQTVIHEP